MKVFVDEKDLSKSCFDCPMLANKTGGESEPYCVLTDIYLGNHNSCPLQSLAEHDKQVRKEVCEEIRDIAGDYWSFIGGEINLSGNDLTEILDRIEEGE